MTASPVSPLPKHRAIYEYLHRGIFSGEFPHGSRLPTEEELARQFRSSRPTAARALNDLEASGYVVRRPGAGSFVSRPQARAAALQFGLLVPGLGETEIFEPICGAIASEAAVHDAGLLWGPGSGAEAAVSGLRMRLRRIAGHFVENRVRGVFFAPVELHPGMRQLNEVILRDLREAEIPVVLLDRDCLPYPERSGLDLVGMQNRRAGFLLARHLLDRGVRRIDFLARPGSAPSVRQRIAGYQEALWAAGIQPDAEWVHEARPDDAAWAATLFRGSRPPEAVICANDITAGELLSTLAGLGVAVPGDLLLGSFDDVKYARLLRPSLTTIRQPCREIGQAAFEAMLSRIANPALPAREISVEGRLVVRASSGGTPPEPGEPG